MTVARVCPNRATDCEDVMIELADAQKRIRELEAALHKYGHHEPACEFLQDTLPCSCGFEALRSTAETPGEPLPKFECGMGCGRTFCSPKGRDHHEELCEGRTPNRDS
jgi:hypothetical protein